METAKVDIRKLQLLNDRIAQCFEALNQVRLSVHGVQGLSHSPTMDPRIAGLAGVQNPAFGTGYGQQPVSPYQTAVSPYQTAAPPYAQGIPSQGIPQGIPGLGHTTALPFAPVAPVWDPRLAATPMVNPLGIGAVGPNPQINPFAAVNPLAAANPLIGLSHTSAEGIDPSSVHGQPAWADPFLAARIVQTFPYATFAFLPVTSSI